MKGLLLKDILMLKSYARTISLMVVIYLVSGITWDNVYFFAGLSGILCIMMVMSSFSYDHYAKWDPYGASLPVTRADMVGAKYLLALVMMGLGAAVTALMHVVFILVRKGEFAALLPITLGTTAAGAFLVSVLLPCVYKFGPEKARLALMLVGVLVGLTVSLGVWLLPGNLEYTAVKLPLIIVLPAVEIAGFYLSYRLSCRIYRRKEL